jgi:hypothetical protein
MIPVQRSIYAPQSVSYVRDILGIDSQRPSPARCRIMRESNYFPAHCRNGEGRGQWLCPFSSLQELLLWRLRISHMCSGHAGPVQQWALRRRRCPSPSDRSPLTSRQRLSVLRCSADLAPMSAWIYRFDGPRWSLPTRIQKRRCQRQTRCQLPPPYWSGCSSPFLQGEARSLPPSAYSRSTRGIRILKRRRDRLD